MQGLSGLQVPWRVSSGFGATCLMGGHVSGASVTLCSTVSSQKPTGQIWFLSLSQCLSQSCLNCNMGPCYRTSWIRDRARAVVREKAPRTKVRKKASRGAKGREKAPIGIHTLNG